MPFPGGKDRAPPRKVVRNRETALGALAFPEERLAVKGPKGDPRLDPRRREAPNDPSPRGDPASDEDRVHPVNIACPRSLRGECHALDVPQQVRIDAGARPAMLNELIDSTELGQADGRLHVRHAVIEREFRMPVIPRGVREREVSKPPGAPCDGVGSGDDHATFAGRDDLVRVEAKTPRGPKTPDRP